MAKFAILGELEAERIPAAVPPGFRALVPMLAMPQTTYHVVLFAHGKESGNVNTSGIVRRALRRVEANSNILAVGQDFTVEATKLLEAHGATIVRASNFGWTDERYEYIRSL